jgi:1-acyl-sn-glycerol-3-phosphate acyltransferase
MPRSEHVLVEQKPPKGLRGWIYRTAVNLAMGIGRLFLFFECTGQENFPRTGPVLVVANHPSYLDPPTLVAISIYYAKRDLSIMAWDKLFRIPVVSFFTRTYKAYPVDRDNPGRGPYVTLVDILKKGGVAGVFPEGSRSAQRLMGPWKPGALRAAFGTEATILPITLVTTGEFWPKKNWRPQWFRRHRVVVHKPIPFSEYSAGIADGPSGRQAQEALAVRIQQAINAPIEAYEAEKQARVHEYSRKQDPLRQRPLPAQTPAHKRERAAFRILGW